MKMKLIISRGLLYFAGLSSSVIFAGVGTSLMRTAEIHRPGEFELKAQMDMVFLSHVTDKNSSGFNLSPHIAGGVIDHMLEVEAWLGVGTTDFQVGGLAQFNLLPDIPGQLGLAFTGGLSFLKDSIDEIGVNAWLWTWGVVASKQFPSENGLWVPYAAYQFEILAVDGPNRYPHTLLLGSRWEPSTKQPWRFYAEIPIGLHRSVYGISVGAGQVF